MIVLRRNRIRYNVKVVKTQKILFWPHPRLHFSNVRFFIQIGFDYRVDDQVDQFSKETKNYGDKFRFKKRSDDDSAFFK